MADTLYGGYYMDSANKMYSVKRGVSTLKTGTVKKGTKYYNYNAKKGAKYYASKSKKTKKLSKWG